MSVSMKQLCQEIRSRWPDSYGKQFKAVFPDRDPNAATLSAEEMQLVMIRLSYSGLSVRDYLTLLQQRITDDRKDARNEKMCAAIAVLTAQLPGDLPAGLPVENAVPEPAVQETPTQETLAELPTVSLASDRGITDSEYQWFKTFRRDNNLADCLNLCPKLAAQGELDMLKVAHRLSWKIGQKTFVSAAERNQVEVLKWLFENVPDIVNLYEVCVAAARNGSLDVLKYMNKAGKYVEIWSTATRAGQLEILQWIVISGLHYDAARVIRGATENGHTHIVDWVKKMGLA